MPEPNTHDPQNAAPIVEGDLDALLTAAETLSGEVAREIGTTRADAAAASVQSAGPMAPGDATRVAALPASNIDAVLAEASGPGPVAAEASSPRPPPAVTKAAGSGGADGKRADGERASDSVRPAKVASTKAGGGAPQAATESRTGEATGAMPVKKVEVKAANGDGGAKAGASAGATEKGKETPPASTGQEGGSRAGLFRRGRAALGRGVSATLSICAAGISIPIGMAVVVMRAVDRPFAGLSGTARNRLGLIGLVSLVTGVLSFVLPSLLRSNPYAHLD